MARASSSKKKPWDAVFRRIRCVYDVAYWHPPKPNDADLDAIGLLLGFDFPASYRAFAQEYGLGGRFGFRPTLYDLSTSVVNATRFCRSGDYWASSHPAFFDTDPPGLAEHFVVFAADESRMPACRFPAHYAFAPTVVTGKRWGECRIYSFSLGSRPEAIADSFGEWLTRIERYYRDDTDNPEDALLRAIFGPDDTDKPAATGFPFVSRPDASDSDPMVYTRHGTRKKYAPDASDVQRWLAWNHGDVLAVARALRDDRRHDAFPVLADSLQDAGCAHDDLLAACRTGDPDVDGLWALAVLLGSDNL